MFEMRRTQGHSPIFTQVATNTTGESREMNQNNAFCKHKKFFWKYNFSTEELIEHLKILGNLWMLSPVSQK